MAPTVNLDGLVRRQYGGYYNNDYYYYNTPWNTWGRWVALVVIVAFVIFIALLFSCVNARRRRSRGLPPRYGTGWMAGKTPAGHNGPSYNPGYQPQGGAYYNNQSAPPYSPPVENQYTGNTFNRNDGYYGQQSGIELQQPANAYQPSRGGDPVYPTPQGAPPGKTGYPNDGVIR